MFWYEYHALPQSVSYDYLHILTRINKIIGFIPLHFLWFLVLLVLYCIICYIFPLYVMIACPFILYPLLYFPFVCYDCLSFNTVSFAIFSLCMLWLLVLLYGIHCYIFPLYVMIACPLILYPLLYYMSVCYNWFSFIYEVSSIKNANPSIKYEGIKLQKCLIVCKKDIDVVRFQYSEIRWKLNHPQSIKLNKISIPHHTFGGWTFSNLFCCILLKNTLRALRM